MGQDTRNIYLKTVPIPEAVDRAKAALDRDRLMGRETVPSHEAAGRVLATPVYGRYSSPTFHSAAMDGIAVLAEDTFSAREGRPVELDPDTGFVPVNTGHPLPEGMNAVIMIEDVVMTPEGRASIQTPAFPWRHVRRIGEDIVATELLIPQNRTLTAYDVGALLSAGIWEVEVHERVRAVFIPTGDEVLDFRDRPEPRPGQVVESNSQVFMAWAETNRIQARAAKRVPDDKEALVAAVRKALEDGAHVVVVGAGSSAGSKDFTRAVFAELGQVLVHGIAAMPGKPTLLAVADIGSGPLLLVGAPGYPVSCVVCLEQVLAPVAAWLVRGHAPARPRASVVLARSTPSKLGVEEYLRLAVGRVGGRLVGTPLGRGAGMITTLTKAQAVARIPSESEGASEGTELETELLVPAEELENVLVHVGSHDNTLDILANELMGLETPMRLTSSHAGSMGGLRALASGTALFAGAHLFDPETADFNFPFLAKYLKNVDVEVVNLAIRHQGLITAKGNPKGIRSTGDLKREDVVFINRQRGAGTRILLDHHLEMSGIEPSEVRGYENEEFTHMAVAVNVLTGAADCGLGIMAAAKALDLGFQPLARERYDLVIPRENLDTPGMQALLGLIRTPEFQARLDTLGGYETSLTGQVMKPGMGLG